MTYYRGSYVDGFVFGKVIVDAFLAVIADCMLDELEAIVSVTMQGMNLDRSILSSTATVRSNSHVRESSRYRRKSSPHSARYSSCPKPFSLLNSKQRRYLCCCDLNSGIAVQVMLDSNRTTS